jgi:CDP-glycerol:poly(glycerophosphate) glycerophosphotransferase
VMVYFPDTRPGLYQLRQWFGPLRALNERHPVIVVMQDSRAARLVRAEVDLPVVVIAHYSRLDELLARSEVKLALYVNHNSQNFSSLRFTSLVHVFLNHGESDKGVSVSNQGKAYDFCFVAGQAAIDRIASRVMLYDAAAHCVTIGRPQIDFDAAPGSRPPLAGRRSAVLYAPTWEGAQPSLSYGSVASHGRALVADLLADGRFAVHYRPHPFNGLLRADYGDADAEIRRLIEDAAAGDPGAGHRIETAIPLADSFGAADLLVCDVSAVATDWLPTQRPLVITVPSGSEVATAGTRLLEVAPRLPVSGLPGVAALVAEQVEQDPGREERLALIDYYLGDTTPGASTRRFLDACTEMIELRDREWASAVGRGATGP